MAGWLLVIASVQIFAVAVIQLSPLESVERAILAGPRSALWLGAGVTVATLAAWMAWHRPAIAAALGSLPLAAVGLLLWRRAHWLAVAYYGELVAYHFVALAAAALIVLATGQWCFELRARWRSAPIAERMLQLGAVTGGLGCAVPLLVSHLRAGHAALAPAAAQWAGVGVIAGIVAVLLAALASVRMARSRVDLLAVALLSGLLLLRILSARDNPLTGGPLDADWVPVVGAAIVVISIGLAVALRASNPLWLTLALAIVAMAATGLAWTFWAYGYGTLEGGLGGLLRSFFAFVPPYPGTVPRTHVAATMVAIFCIFTTTYTNLVSTPERLRGLGLGLCAAAGIGMTSPALILWWFAGSMMLIEAARVVPEIDEDADSTRGSAARQPHGEPMAHAENLMEALAMRLDLDVPVVVDGIARLRGTVGGVEVVLRAQRERGRLALELRIGSLGRGAALVSLRPEGGSAGQRPTHAIARTHRVHGDLRALESLGDRPLDALSALEGARWELHPAGSLVTTSDLGDVDAWDALIRALVAVAQG